MNMIDFYTREKLSRIKQDEINHDAWVAKYFPIDPKDLMKSPILMLAIGVLILALLLGLFL
jgi:hypothetical protein